MNAGERIFHKEFISKDGVKLSEDALQDIVNVLDNHNIKLIYLAHLLFNKDKDALPELIEAKKTINIIRKPNPTTSHAYEQLKPHYATKMSAGFDLRADVEESVFIDVGETKLVGTGLCFDLQNTGLYLQLASRSSLGVKYNVVLANGVGVIDGDYQGEVMVAMHNTGKERYKVNPLDRICQGTLLPLHQACFKETSEFTHKTARGEGRFGSTGKN